MDLQNGNIGDANEESVSYFIFKRAFLLLTKNYKVGKYHLKYVLFKLYI